MPVRYGERIMKVTKKIVALVLCLSMLLSAAALALTSAAQPEVIPLVYINGYGSGINQYDENGRSLGRVDDVLNTEDITAFLNDNTTVFMKAFATQDWTEFCDNLVAFMLSEYEYARLDENGDPRYNTRAEQIHDEAYARKFTGTNIYIFNYDWRLDPTENMDELSAYVEAVLKVSGSSVYAMLGRCEGAAIALTYYETYKDPRMVELIFYASAAKGASPIGEAFSGNLKTDSDSIERYIYQTEELHDLSYPVTDNFIFTYDSLVKILRIANNVYGLDLACWAVNNVYQQIWKSITPEALRGSYASFPGFWAMCEDKYYEDAKAAIFEGVEEEYAGFITKIDNYHYNIMNKAEDILLDAAENGVTVNNIVKYGKQLFPVVENSAAQSDGVCTVENASFGAYSVDIGKTFDSNYINNAVRTGKVKYISPDICIDASTALFPDNTWFIKNMMHAEFPNTVNDFAFYLAQNPQANVNTDARYPQYMFYQATKERNEKNVLVLVEDSLLPYDSTEQKNDIDDLSDTYNNSFFRKIKPVFYVFYKLFEITLKVLTPRARS